MSNKKQRLNRSKPDLSAEESQLQETPPDFQRIKTSAKDRRGVALDPAVSAGRLEKNAEELLRSNKGRR